ncbi:helix-turn-helix domain-containing protein [Cohnella ginsengisoli]|uniref:Helix-turn-helix domain-containing protein n=1 Tax=Cohnella ginsengisoli TaxID=425004 RepID=A0A9X4QQD0_9BACL|nr:helix-turn-helix domain-containing protein [Cohnella ginsengisoli]MDG0793610.1 helix-turn-helix domain-containing protein [Cohnella ginsengisoli]
MCLIWDCCFARRGSNGGYTLDDIQEITKIRKRYLEAIESGDYKVLPGSFYVRAFVKTYAETVGLDAEEVLRLYQKRIAEGAGDRSGRAGAFLYTAQEPESPA